jgi:hypothetical protein
MEQTQQNNSEPFDAQQATAKAAILAECDKLMAAGGQVRGRALRRLRRRSNDRRSEVLQQRMVRSLTSMSLSNTTLSTFRDTSRFSCPSDMKTIAVDSEMSF